MIENGRLEGENEASGDVLLDRRKEPRGDETGAWCWCIVRSLDVSLSEASPRLDPQPDTTATMEGYTVTGARFRCKKREKERIRKAMVTRGLG